MTSRRKDLAVLVFTEDGGSDGGKRAFATVTALVKKLLRYIDGACNNEHIAFAPATDEAREVLVANLYVNRRDLRRRRLYEVVAAQLKLDDGFVFHHFDADCRWADRNQEQPLNAKPVQQEILDHVRVLLEMPPRRGRRERSQPVERAEVDAMLARYIRLVPYWEIEAWLYQNTDKALSLARHRPGCRCAELLAAWRADRALLDEQPHPSDQLCIGKQHNDELVQGFPTAEVYAAGKSLAAAVDAMLECAPLLHAIQRTYQHPIPGPEPA